MQRALWVAGVILGLVLIIVGVIGDDPAPACIEVVGADCPPESSSPPLLVVLGALTLAVSLGLAAIIKLLSVRSATAPSAGSRPRPERRAGQAAQRQRRRNAAATSVPVERPRKQRAGGGTFPTAPALTLLGSIGLGLLWFAGWLGSGQCDDACEVEPVTMAKLALLGFACSLMSAIAAVHSFRNPASFLVAVFFLLLAGGGFLALALVVRLA